MGKTIKAKKYYLKDEEAYYIIRLLERDYNNCDEAFKKGEKGKFIKELKDTILDRFIFSEKGVDHERFSKRRDY